MAIAMVVPGKQIQLAGGIMQAVSIFFAKLGISGLVKPFGVLVIIGVLCGLASWSTGPRVIQLLHRHVNSSAQLPIRISVLLIASLVLLAFELGLDVLLGAFAAGVVVRLLVRGEDTVVVRG
ncbi:MAG TPA: cation:proton antiporter, partial [Streptosporangiaceae bacterium]|nr:cation:proton antiporter [Streptosporangiaceae bacterium]